MKKLALIIATAFVLLPFRNASGDEDLQLDDKHVRVAEEMADIYASSFDMMDHLLRAYAGFDHDEVGIATEDWRDLPPLYKLETAYLAAERSGSSGGEKMLALMAQSMAKEYSWMRDHAAFQSFVSREKIGEVSFAKVTLTEVTENRPQLAPAAKLLAGEITNICTSGFDARRVLTEYFELSPERARTLVNERQLKDAFERAFQEVGSDVKLDKALTKFVTEMDSESVGFRQNRWFNPWRGSDGPDVGPVAKNDGPKNGPSGGGANWLEPGS